MAQNSFADILIRTARGSEISETSLVSTRTYAFLPIHRRRLLISIYHQYGTKELRGEAKKSYLTLAPTTSDVISTYIANKTSSHVIPILFLTRIDQPDSI